MKMGKSVGCKVYAIKEGFRGLINGGESIVAAERITTDNIIQRAGTVLGSARCKDFQKWESRVKAGINLLTNDITNLICIGGDDSLIWASQFQTEWPTIVKQLVAKGEITNKTAEKCSHLNVVGLFGSIDDDFCGTDMTIGADTALNRFIETIDNIGITDSSHQRCVVLEVMGRRCGYVALVAALASEADWVFIPELPSEEGWEDSLCQKLHEEEKAGQRLSIIVVAEGAVDSKGKAITAIFVKNVVINTMKYDALVTILGHVQRGGKPSSFDRIQAGRMGAEAVLALMDAAPNAPASVISLHGNQTVQVPLSKCIIRAQAVQNALDGRQFQEAMEYRGWSFAHCLETYRTLSKVEVPIREPSFNLALMCVGTSAPGISAAARSFVRVGLTKGFELWGIESGFEGLLRSEVKKLMWTDVQKWTGMERMALGMTRTVPDESTIEQIANKLKEFQIHGLAIIGGAEAYRSVLFLARNRQQHLSLCIPLMVIPSSEANDVPGTENCVGSDTAVNELVNICEKMKGSTSTNRSRIIITDTSSQSSSQMGEYLATMSALATGVDCAKVCGDRCGLCLTEGRRPSAFDRIYGLKMGAKCAIEMGRLVEANKTKEGGVNSNKPDTCLQLCQRKAETVFVPVENLEHYAPQYQELRKLADILTEHDMTSDM